jgi:hypothetical protein
MIEAKKGYSMLRLPTLLLVTLMLFLGGCSIKKINENVDSITGDITSAFENSRDK